MGALMFLVQAVTPTISPTATPNTGADIVSTIETYGSIAASLAASIASIATHPIIAGISLGVLVLVGGVAYLIIKKKIEDAEIAAAAKDTQTGYDNTVTQQTGQNQTDNDKDSSNFGKMDGLN